jgi:hypothetical protein
MATMDLPKDSPSQEVIGRVKSQRKNTPTWIPNGISLSDFEGECAMLIPLVGTNSPEHLDEGIYTPRIIASRYVAKDPILTEDECRLLFPSMTSTSEKIILSVQPSFPLDLLRKVSLEENSLLALAFIFYHPKATREIQTVVRLRWGSKAVGNQGERTQYEEKHTNQFEWLKETRNPEDIETAVYGEHTESRVWVIRNSRLTADQVRHLVPMYRESMFLLFPLSYCPNTPRDVLLDLALTESDPQTRRMVSRHPNADEEIQTLVALRVPEDWDPLD